MTSAESDYLLRLATLSLSFVGFAAVVVSIRGALGGELSDRHLRLVRLYIEGGLLVRRRRAVEPGRFPAWVVIVNAISIVAVAALWLNVAGIPFRPSGGPYAVVLTWALCTFGFIFVRTIELFLHRGPHA